MTVLDDAGIQAIVCTTRRIAVIGASSNEVRPSFAVFRYLLHQGVEFVPINPNERDVLGVPVFGTLDEAVAATGPFDMGTSSGVRSCASRMRERSLRSAPAACGCSWAW